MNIILVLLLIFLSGCAHISKDGRTFYGWGSAKRDSEGKITEITSGPPLPPFKFEQ